MTTTKIKKGDWVRVKSGKFTGWQGRIFNREKEGKEVYFDVFPHYRKTRKGEVRADMVGLGMILNIKKQNLKKVM